MEKRVLGVQTKNNPIKKSKKRFLNKVMDYLKSDSYMFAPLISTPYTDFLASDISSSNIVEMKDSKKGRKKRLLEKVRHYLKSDSYMYAPLFAPKPITSPKGHARYLKRIAMEVSTRKLTRNDNKSTVESSNITIEDQFSEDNLPERSISGQQKSVHKETVKHMVYQSCRYSLSGKEMHDPQIRKFLVD